MGGEIETHLWEVEVKELPFQLIPLASSGQTETCDKCNPGARIYFFLPTSSADSHRFLWSAGKVYNHILYQFILFME